MEAIGSRLPTVIQNQGILAHYVAVDDEAPTMKLAYERLAKLVEQITHRYPRMNILGIGTS